MTESNNMQVQTPPQVSSRRDWGDWLLHRWPTALGIAVVLLTVFGEEIDNRLVSFLAALIVVMPLVYLGAAVFARRSAAWLVLLVGLALILPLRLFDLGIVPALGLLGIALALLVIGLVRDQWRNTGGLLLQTLGMIGFGAVGFAVLYVDLQWAGYLLAAALFGHAVWDAIHWWRDRVVPRSYAEFCGVFDLLLGMTILVMLSLT